MKDFLALSHTSSPPNTHRPSPHFQFKILQFTFQIFGIAIFFYGRWVGCWASWAASHLTLTAQNTAHSYKCKKVLLSIKNNDNNKFKMAKIINLNGNEKIMLVCDGMIMSVMGKMCLSCAAAAHTEHSNRYIATLTWMVVHGTLNYNLFQ